MTARILSHPHRELMAEAQHERAVADSVEAETLRDRIVEAVFAYAEFLGDQGVLYDTIGDWGRMKASALVVTCDPYCGSCCVTLKDGALDRVYGNGVNPDPSGQGPADIPRSSRRRSEALPS
jgi:hypothetical protein